MSADPDMALALFLLVCAALLLLPFYPAWQEWQRPTDRQALRMATGDDSQASLARLLRQQMTRLLGSGQPVAFGSLEQALAGILPTPAAEPDAPGSIDAAPQGLAFAQGSCFQQIDAPVIVFGHPVSPDHTATHPHRRPAHAPINGAQRWGLHGWRVAGDCVIQGGQHFTGSLVVTGLLSIGKGACVEGDVKAHQGVLIGEHARVTGSVVSDQGVRLFDDAFVGGPLVCETLLQLGSGARLGSLHAPTSVSAAVILAGDGATAHGSVRASQAGLVWGQA